MTSDASAGTVGLLAESIAGERRVALVPEDVNRITKLGWSLAVETGAGSGAWRADTAYETAGARVAPRAEVLAAADLLLCVQPPDSAALTALRPGQGIVGLLQPLVSPDLVETLAAAGATALSLDLLPRQLSRAQVMDALTSQASVVGYRAAIEAAAAYGRFFPLLVTAAGTARPAEVLVLGAGVAGLQAIATARRLGAVVSAYDVRPDAAEQVRSLGATFVELSESVDGAGAGGYARALTDDEEAGLRNRLAPQVARRDIVITTAQVPGRRPPLLVSADALAGMKPGSVIVDCSAGPLGRGVELGDLDPLADRVVTPGGVTIVRGDALASAMAPAASAAYSRNITALVALLLFPDGLRVDREDEIVAGVLVTIGGRVVHPLVLSALPALAPTGGAA